MRVLRIAFIAFVCGASASWLSFDIAFAHFSEAWSHGPYPTMLHRFQGVVESHDPISKTLTILYGSNLRDAYPALRYRFSYADDTLWASRTLTVDDDLVTRFEYRTPVPVPRLVPGTFVTVGRDPYALDRFAAESIVYLRRVEL